MGRQCLYSSSIKPDKTKLQPKFLKYYLQSNDGFQQITGKMTGAAIRRIILKTIKAALVPVPPIEEQRRIVAKLDALSAQSRATATALTRIEALITR